MVRVPEAPVKSPDFFRVRDRVDKKPYLVQVPARNGILPATF
jgi:hypothetical protein